MDKETVNLIVAAIVGGAIPFVGKWLINTYIPSRQKQAQDQAIHDRQRDDTSQALGSDLAKEMLGMIDALTDGEAATRYSKITQQLTDIENKLDSAVSSLNQLGVFLSRNQAALPVIGHVSDWTNEDEIKSAAIKSASDQKAAAILAAGVTTDEAKSE